MIAKLSYLADLYEKCAIKALARLTFNTSGQLNTVTAVTGSVACNINAGQGVYVMTGPMSQSATGQLASQQTFQCGFRRNLIVS